MRKTYRFSHSVVQGGYLYIHKSHTAITDKDALRMIVQQMTEKYQLLDVTLKIYEKLLFLFFMSAPRYKREDIIDEILRAIESFGTWDSEYLLTSVYDLSEQTVRAELSKLDFDYDEGGTQTKPVQKNIAPIILSAVQTLSCGRQKLALFLAGSKAEPLAQLRQKPGYGGLFWHDARIIEGFLLQLQKQRYIAEHIIRTPEYSYPILVLTEQGKQALEKKTEIPLVKLRPPAIVGETELKTYELFIQGKSPQQIADQRELQVSTVYDHFIKLIEAGKMSAKTVVNSQVIGKVLKAKATFLREPRLKELKERLPDISYTELRCVLGDKKLLQER